MSDVISTFRQPVASLGYVGEHAKRRPAQQLFVEFASQIAVANLIPVSTSLSIRMVWHQNG